MHSHVGLRQASVGSDVQCLRDLPDRCFNVAHCAAIIEVACDLDAGEFEVRLFAAPAGTRAGRYGYIGSILVNSR